MTTTQEHADKIADTRPGSGWKQCPHCKKWIKGPTTPTCYSCGTNFPKPQGNGKGKTSNGKPQGFGDALGTLSKVKGYIDKQGGFDKATEAVKEMEGLIDSCGSVAALKQAIATLENWGGN